MKRLQTINYVNVGTFQDITIMKQAGNCFLLGGGLNGKFSNNMDDWFQVYTFYSFVYKGYELHLKTNKISQNYFPPEI